MPNGARQLLIATNNPGKVSELRGFLSGMPFTVRSLDDFPGIPEVPETGSTFAENARLKAAGYALETGLYSIADDSGLEVAALDGRPGVLSARYGGEGISFGHKMGLLLAELDGTGKEDRTARFVCSIAISDPQGTILAAADGICAGRLTDQPRGSGGFGYDPLFVPDGHEQTFGELSDTVKQKISHRFRAFEQIMPFLRHFNAL